MLYIAIIDDEPLARSRLKRQLDSVPDCCLVGEGASGEEAVSLAEKLRPDVLLLDIRMPGMDGITAAHQIQRLKQPPVIIFCTAYDEHALRAFEENALDYLVKPVRLQRLNSALEKARKFLGKLQHDGNSSRRYLRSKVGDRVELVPVDNIIFFRAEHKYTTVGLDSGTLVIDDTLKVLEREFEHQFVRIHRNALVAKSRIRGLNKAADGYFYLTLEGTDTKLEVSRRNVPGIRKLLREL